MTVEGPGIGSSFTEGPGIGSLGRGSGTGGGGGDGEVGEYRPGVCRAFCGQVAIWAVQWWWQRCRC